MLKRLLFGEPGVHISPSIEDFSLGTQHDAEETFGSPLADPVTPHSPPPPSSDAAGSPPPPRGAATARVWREIFHPGSPRVSTGPHGADFYDSSAGGVWDEVLKAERLAAAARLAREGDSPGAIDAAALKRELGGGADVDKLIAEAVVKDGKVDFGAFKRALSGKQ